MIIDTHEAVERIVEAGASKKMAEAIVKSFNSSSENLATKADLLQVKTELKSEIAQVRSELKSDIAQVRSELAEVRTELKNDIAEVRTELKVLATQFANVKWVQYAILGLLLAPMAAQFIGLYVK